MPQKRKAFQKGNLIGTWTLVEKLGSGGSGEVWRATNGDGRPAALKVLSKVEDAAYKRFSDEISVMTENPSPGIIPIIDWNLPAVPRDERAWYAMPIGIPLQTHLRDASAEKTVDAIFQIAKTLSSLHLKNIVHRDVKPANMPFLDSAPRLADFGLVSYPAKAQVTKPREAVGPRATMAPEARRGAKSLNLKATDVYALAKSLWILLSRQSAGFEGQYSSDQSISIRGSTAGLYIEPLETALQKATAHKPSERPSMDAFARMLDEWLKVSQDWRRRNPEEWSSTIGKIFPTVVPKFASWEGREDILRVLRFIASNEGLNHMFIPSGGGLDLTDVAQSSREPDCVELRSQWQALVVKPRVLQFYHFVGSPGWSYFSLQTEALPPSGVAGSQPHQGQELLTELPWGEYVDPMVWEYHEWNGEPLPIGTRQISRFTSGSFAFFQKSSPYNWVNETYDARHTRLDPEKFRAHVDELRIAIGNTQDFELLTSRLSRRNDLRNPAW